MKKVNDEEFKELYTDICRKYQDKIEKWKKDVKLSKILYGILIGFLLIVLAIVFVTPFKTLLATNKATFYAILIAVILIVVVLVAYASSLKSNYRKGYKKTVLADVITRANDKFTFSETSTDNGSDIKRYYEMAGLDELTIMSLGQIFSGVRRDIEMRTKNYVDGTVLDGMPVKMSEINVDEVKKIRKMVDGRMTESTQRIDLFNGLFIHMNIPSAVPVDFSVFTRDPLIKNRYEKDRTKKEGRGFFLAKSESWRGLEVYSEQPEKVEAYVTEELGAVVKEMDKASNIRTDIAFKGNNVFIRMHKVAFFEPINEENRNKELLKVCYNTIKLLEDLAEELDNANKK